MEHHEASIDAFVVSARDGAACDAVIVAGSVARGTERPDSDVDLYLLVSEQAFERARRDGTLSYVAWEGATYEGGYFDIKLITEQYLDRAAVSGDDPCRASFEGARIAWSNVDGLDQRIERIVRLPDEEWQRREAGFIAHARLQVGYFLPQAYEHGNLFLLQHAAVHLVLAYGRALLALNRELFKAPKYLDRSVAQLERVPTGYGDLSRAVLANPNPDTALALSSAVEQFHRWPVTAEETLSRYVEENELSWLTGLAPTEYW